MTSSTPDGRPGNGAHDGRTGNGADAGHVGHANGRRFEGQTAVRSDGRPDDPSARGPGGDTAQRLRAAARALQTRGNQRWVEIADDVVAAAMTSTRRSHPLRAFTPGGVVFVSEQVVISYLRDAIDADTRDAATTQITLQVANHDLLTGVLIQLIARYGQPLIPIADQVRAIVTTTLERILGPNATAVTVNTLRVHYSDVIDGDPHTEDPADPS